ncbi:hypothetical protein D1155_07715 [Anaerotruncus sp. 80]|uniref:Uncharacterized protein n=1 Tax=Anaerotruncus colihominis TaxID=169435 RepID=A0A845QLB3_9FIRM|nr:MULTISPECIES: hypothetical protein [Clostridia]MCI9641051.1 hypothetical protein [Emergencia sp.]NBH61533.1 hypothetical protein [Anaerotruncus colihominis]NCE99997.1 hypothetical protein [Emergencia sp. 1XD21-10]NCF02188.1 hypothetical protein [Anaerotruncus sp. 80]
MTEIMTAAITATGLIIVQLIVSSRQQRAQDIKVDAALSEVRKDIQRLEEKQDKHNNLIERTAVLERDVKTVFKRVDENKAEIAYLEHKGK